MYLSFSDFYTTTYWVLISYKVSQNKTFHNTKTHTILCLRLKSSFEQRNDLFECRN